MLLPSAVASRVFTREELCLMEQKPDPCGIVIFGASGDLAHRKLLPALFKLSLDKVLPDASYVLGVGRTPLNDDTFRNTLRPSLAYAGTPEARSAFMRRCLYQQGSYDDPQLYAVLQQRLASLEQAHGIPGRRIFYLSTPPSLYETIIRRLGEAGMNNAPGKDGWVRMVVEKPFGHDRSSAIHLNQCLYHVFDEDQIYRIDHYLGKETVQNILMFRFANAIYEPLWNRKYIDHIEITAAESEGVGHRAGYYEQSGVLRDMFQNHLFQLLSLVAMEPPSSLDANALRDETAKVIASLRPLGALDAPKAAVRGQYAAGIVDGERLPGYREEAGVNPRSSVETYAALRLEIENWRWQGVPIYLRSGKRLAGRVTEISIQFKHVPASIFKPLMAEQLSANVLIFRIQPNEGIALQFQAKHPGPKLCMSTVTMHFNYEEAFGTPPPDAYTRLYLDVMLGDQTLFARKDWLIESWGFLGPLLDFWAAQKEKGLCFYPAGGWGPPEADALIAQDGRQWLTKWI